MNNQFMHGITNSSSVHISKNKLTIQEAVLEVGGFHQYQLRVFILFALQWMIACMLLVSTPIIFMKPSFLCDGVNCSEDDGGCEKEIVNPSSVDSISKEFHLYCSQRTIRSVAESSVFLGAFIGNLIFSLISINRRSHIGVTWLIGSIGCFGLSFSPNIYIFIMFYALAGFGCNTAIFVQFSIMSEQGSQKFLQWGVLGCMVSWSIAEMLLALILYEVTDWRNFVRWFVGVPALVLNITYFLIYESPKFAYLSSKSDALKILNNIAKINKKTLLADDALKEWDEEHIKHELDQRKYTIVDLFKYPSLRFPTLILMLTHCFIELFYWGTGFALPSLGLNVYMNLCLFGVAELIFYLASEICMRKFKRKTFFIWIGFLCTILSLVFYYMNIPEYCQNSICAIKIFKTFFVMLARGLVCMCLTMMYVYFNEFFPTSVKAIGSLIAFASGSAGSIFASYVVDYSEQLKIPAMVFLGFLMAIETILCFGLKETFEIPNEQQIEELKFA